MTLEEAYMMRRQECLALKRENSKLSAIIEKLRKGEYTDPDKVEHIRKISELTREIQKKDKIIDRYRKLYEAEQLITAKASDTEMSNASSIWNGICRN